MKSAMAINAVGEMSFGISRRVVYLTTLDTEDKEKCDIYNFEIQHSSCETILWLIIVQTIVLIAAFGCMMHSFLFNNINNGGNESANIPRFKLKLHLLLFPSILCVFYIIVEILYGFFAVPIGLVASLYEGFGLAVFFVSGLYYAEYWTRFWVHCKCNKNDRCWGYSVFIVFVIHVIVWILLFLLSVFNDLSSVENAASPNAAFILVVTSNAIAVEWIHIFVDTQCRNKCCQKEEININ